MRQKQSIFSLFLLSSSSWRAWIEIRRIALSALFRRVALLAEGVDRNNEVHQYQNYDNIVALLAEGVDRNIITPRTGNLVALVALLAEGVDRNDKGYKVAADADRRPPHGGRG